MTKAEHAAPGVADAVHESGLTGQLVIPGIGNDTLDTGGASRVERCWGQLVAVCVGARGAVVHRWHTHGGVDLLGTVLFFFVKVVGRSFLLVCETVFGMEMAVFFRSLVVLIDKLLELRLGFGL